MTVYQKGSEKVENYREFHFLTSGQMGGLAREKSSRSSLDRDKKTRREIANSNERRRMQSINSGFQQLKALLPESEDDKRSKSVILHQAVEYITKLEAEKVALINQNSRLTQLLQEGRLVKRKRGIDFSGSDLDLFQSDNTEILAKVERLARELRAQLDDERRRRLACERQLDSIKAALKSSSSSSSLLMVNKSSGSLTRSPDSIEVTKVLEEVDATITLPVDDAAIMSMKKDDGSSRTAMSTIVSCSMSRRNLETIVQAIRHLEGDQESNEHRLTSTSQSIVTHPRQKLIEKSEQLADALKLTATPLIQLPKQIHLQGHPQLLSIVQSCKQLSSPYASPLSSPPLSSTPPQVFQQSLGSPHHLISPIIICQDSSFLKNAPHLAAISAFDRS